MKLDGGNRCQRMEDVYWDDYWLVKNDSKNFIVLYLHVLLISLRVFVCGTTCLEGLQK